jgi:CBS domain-containing membrane protein
MVRRRFRKVLSVSKYILYKETLVDFKEIFWSFTGAFIGIALIAFFQSSFLTQNENIFLIGSFGASSVLVYGAVQSPMAQPRNLIGGHLISALIGVSAYTFLPNIIWLTAPFAVALSIVLMQVTKTLHPPGGATALIAIIGSEKVKALGFMYVLSPVLSGSLILFIVACIFNNMTPNRRYPTTKRFTKSVKKLLVLRRRYINNI